MKLPESIIQAVKEALRIVVLAVLPLIIVGIDPVTGAFAINWAIVQATALLALLRAIDKWLHERADEGTGYLKAKGLTGF